MTKKRKAAPTGTAQYDKLSSNITSHRGGSKRIRVALLLLQAGPVGASSLSGLAKLHDLNFRNSISRLRLQNGIMICDEYFIHCHRGGGIARFKRYWLPTQDEALKLCSLVRYLQTQDGAPLLSDEQAEQFARQFTSTSSSPIATAA